MTGLFHFILAILASPLKSKLRLEAENAMLRHQLMVLRRGVRGRVAVLPISPHPVPTTNCAPLYQEVDQ